MWTPFGEHAVGFVELEAAGAQPVAGRLFYPASLSSAASAGASWLTPWRWRLPFFSRGEPWLWHAQYARGLARFLFFRLHGRMYDVLKQLFIGFVWALGKSQRLDLHPGAPLASDLPDQLPLIIFSHGLGGHRFLYSIICSELASQGYCVFALDHADGSASAALQPGGVWKLYGGLGDSEAQVAKTRVRVAEMKAALAAMQALHRGDRLPGLKLSGGMDPAAFLRGRLDMRCVAAAGHSYGGATATALVAEDPRFRCAIALDPWWYAVFPEAKALRRFETRTPLLVMGSHDWNVPNSFGELYCGGTRQQQILEAAKARQEGGERTGGGAMLLCIAGSSHNTFADALPLFGQHSGWLLERLGLSARLDPVLGIHLCTTAMLAFLGLHLPLNPQQRAVQNWEPGKPGSASRWACIQQHDVADSGTEWRRGGPLSWMFPGRGLLVSASDMLMNRILPKPSAFRQAPQGPREGGKVAAGAAGHDQNGGPDDVVTGLEAAEAVLPSANPASGPHPHAPGARTNGTQPASSEEEPGSSKGGGSEAGGSSAQQEHWARQARQAELSRAGLNSRYSSAVEEREAGEMTAPTGQAPHLQVRYGVKWQMSGMGYLREWACQPSKPAGRRSLRSLAPLAHEQSLPVA